MGKGKVLGFWFNAKSKESLKKKRYIEETVKKMQEYQHGSDELDTKSEALYLICLFFNAMYDDN